MVLKLDGTLKSPQSKKSDWPLKYSLNLMHTYLETKAALINALHSYLRTLTKNLFAGPKDEIIFNQLIFSTVYRWEELWAQYISTMCSICSIPSS